MSQKFYPHSRSGIRRQVKYLLHPGLIVCALMEDRLLNVTRAIGDVSVLPIERDAIYSARPVPEAYSAPAHRDVELLIERGVTRCLTSGQAAHVARKISTMNRIAAARTRHKRAGIGIIDCPGRQRARFETAIYHRVACCNQILGEHTKKRCAPACHSIVTGRRGKTGMATGAAVSLQNSVVPHRDVAKCGWPAIVGTARRPGGRARCLAILGMSL